MCSYCCSYSDVLKSHYIVLPSSFLLPFHALLDVVVHFFIFLRSFRFKSFLSQSLLSSHRSRLSVVTQSFIF